MRGRHAWEGAGQPGGQLHPRRGQVKTQGCLLAPRPGVFYSGFLSVRASGRHGQHRAACVDLRMRPGFTVGESVYLE